MSLSMYKKMWNAIDGLNNALRVAISNTDNFNTVGYKYTFASFTSTFNEAYSSGTETVNPKDFGGSMTLGATSIDFSQGSLTFGTDLDVAISGEGFFIVSETAAEFSSASEKLYTRAGRFQVDFSGQYLVDPFGRKVFGYRVNPDGTIADRTLVPLGPEGHSDIGFTDDGLLVANFGSHNAAVAEGAADIPDQIPLYRLALTDFTNKQGLLIDDGAAFRATVSSGEAREPGASGEGNYGNIKGQKLESSNVQVARVALDMALLNRGFSATQGMMDDINKIMSGLISKLAA